MLRHSDGLDDALIPLLKRGLDATDPVVRDILRLGAYQLLRLERVPRHAAVATAVELTREAVGDHATGFVNAVLRRVTAEAPITDPAGEIGVAASLARESSHPEWLVGRWLTRFGEAETRALLEWNNQHPPLVVQPSDGSIDALASRFDQAGVRHFRAPHGAGLVVEETHPDRLPGFADGAFFVQDPAQALVVRFAGIPKGATVYDACAAPGGKTMALARTAGAVVAGDAARRRVPRLRENLARTGSGRAWPVVADAFHPPVREVDAVLLDAPCLGTGTFSRHPDARLRVRADALARIVTEQERLLDAVATRVRPGGMLCYATCSLEIEEDGAQVDAFLMRHPEFRRAPIDGLDLPLTAEGDLLILPQRHGMDGAFAARMVREG